MYTSPINRRSFLFKTSLATSGLALGGFIPTQGIASNSSDSETVLNFNNTLTYSFKIGTWDAWSICDGSSMFPNILNFMAPVEDHEKMTMALETALLTPDPFQFYFNILVLKKDAELIIFDSGYGTEGPATAGRLITELKKIGAEPGDVTHLFLSHAHPDHIGGMVDKSNKPVFQKAKIIVTEPEVAFWTSGSPDFSKSRFPKQMLKGLIPKNIAAFEALKSLLEVVPYDSEPISGIKVLDGAGHTAGHAIYNIKSENDELFHISDLAHNHVLMFENPVWNIAFDTFPEKAIERRTYWFKLLAEKKVPVFGFHMPFPAIGHITAKAEKSFRWLPKSWI